MSVIKGTLIRTETTSIPIESLRPGQLVLTHRNRLRRIIEVHRRTYSGEAIEIRFHEQPGLLVVSPEQIVATYAPPLPEYRARVRTARYLRKNHTIAENLLWQRLRNHSLKVRFRRQHPMGDFVLDFYCPQARLAIEVDGGIHDFPGQEEYDRFRQRLIEYHEVAFLRFTNADLQGQVPRVLGLIAKKVRERLVRFDHAIAWIPAKDCIARTILIAGGRTHCAKSTRHVMVQDEFYELVVAEDGSFLTEFCSLRGQYPALTSPHPPSRRSS